VTFLYTPIEGSILVSLCPIRRRKEEYRRNAQLVRWAGEDRMSAPTIDPVIATEQPRRLRVARWIRRLAVPIIVG